MTLDLDALTLTAGVHYGPEDGLCVMEAFAGQLLWSAR